MDDPLNPEAVRERVAYLRDQAKACVDVAMTLGDGDGFRKLLDRAVGYRQVALALERQAARIKATRKTEAA
jgi:hypothetical protein